MAIQSAELPTRQELRWISHICTSHFDPLRSAAADTACPCFLICLLGRSVHCDTGGLRGETFAALRRRCSSDCATVCMQRR